MNVKFSEKLVYVELDSTHSGKASSSVNTKTDDCTATQSSGGKYDFDITLDDCGTTVEQSGGSITFKNTIIGNTDALKVDNIVTTESLELAVECVFTDNFDLKVEDIGIEAADHEIAGSDATGKFDTVFTLKSYTDAGFTSLSTTSNAVTIGKPVYNRVEVTSLPSNVDFYVTDCTAADTAAADGTTYKVIQDGCLDKLLDVKDITDKLVGDSSTKQVDFSFNGFTFPIHLIPYIYPVRSISVQQMIAVTKSKLVADTDTSTHHVQMLQVLWVTTLLKGLKKMPSLLTKSRFW